MWDPAVFGNVCPAWMERKVNMRSDALVPDVERPAVIRRSCVLLRLPAADDRLHVVQPHMRNERLCGGRLSDGEALWELAQYIAAASVLWAST